MNERRIWTVGHSNRGLSEFLALLQSHRIQLVADVRRFPGSKRQPHFRADDLETALAEHGIRYQHFPGLGGRRGSRLEQSPNNGWRIESFRSYADYMLSEEFTQSLDRLAAAAITGAAAVMCAEAVPWHCHRRLIADALTVRGWSVLDIYSTKRTEAHRLTDFASVNAGRLTYPDPLPPT